MVKSLFVLLKASFLIVILEYFEPVYCAMIDSSFTEGNLNEQLINLKDILKIVAEILIILLTSIKMYKEIKPNKKKPK